MEKSNAGDEYSREILDVADDAAYFGRMNSPTGSACVKGPCGDEMEVYLLIENGRVKDIKIYTEGCAFTRACGIATARQVIGKSVLDALDVSPKNIMDLLKDLPKGHRHCAILAVTALYRAVADYLLKP